MKNKKIAILTVISIMIVKRVDRMWTKSHGREST